jgi:hypothetical protein
MSFILTHLEFQRRNKSYKSEYKYGYTSLENTSENRIPFKLCTVRHNTKFKWYLMLLLEPDFTQSMQNVFSRFGQCKFNKIQKGCFCFNQFCFN